MSYLWITACAIAISVMGVGLVLRYATRTGQVDIPNQRSSHKLPTPRGGGVALIGSVILVTAYELPRVDGLGSPMIGTLGALLVVLSLVGWLDDRGSIPVSLRLPVHIACGVMIAAIVNKVDPMPGSLNLLWLGWWIFWTVGSINIVNFMDGIDGMIGSQGLVYGLFLFALLPHALLGARFGLILAGACLGFLMWNWEPAKIFMGDSGSGPLGLLFVVGGAFALEGARPLLVFLPLFPLFFDALVTLVRRARKREKLIEAHRSHLYQRIANAPAGHAGVSAAYALAASIGALVALSVRQASVTAAMTAILAYATCTVVTWYMFDRRFPDRV